jgi:hypothetical protein
MKISTPPSELWPEAMATVTACKYQFGAGRALAFGIPTTRHFLITFNYWAPNAEGTPELHTGQFTSAKALPQGSLFPITYNPAQPQEHCHSATEPLTRTPIIAIGIIGSAILSLTWLLILRSCH